MNKTDMQFHEPLLDEHSGWLWVRELGLGGWRDLILTPYALMLLLIIFTVFLNEKKNVNQTPTAWERTLWSWGLLSTAGRRSEQAHGTGLVLRRPHDSRHGNLLPRSGWCRWVRMVGGFPVSSWGESSPTPFGQPSHHEARAHGLPQAVFQGPQTKRTSLYQISNAKDVMNCSDFGCLDWKLTGHKYRCRAGLEQTPRGGS